MQSDKEKKISEFKDQSEMLRASATSLGVTLLILLPRDLAEVEGSISAAANSFITRTYFSK